MNLERFLNKENWTELAGILNRYFRFTTKLDGDSISSVRITACLGANHTNGGRYYHQVPSDTYLSEGINSTRKPIYIGRVYGVWDVGDTDDVAVNFYGYTNAGAVTQLLFSLLPGSYDTTTNLASMPIDYDQVIFTHVSCDSGAVAHANSALSFVGIEIHLK